MWEENLGTQAGIHKIDCVLLIWGWPYTGFIVFFMNALNFIFAVGALTERGHLLDRWYARGSAYKNRLLIERGMLN